MASMEVTPSEMQNIANEIKGKMEQWNTSVEKIFSLQQELDAMWEGEAHDEFVRVFTEDKPKFSRLYEIMQEYQNSIITSANAYIEADRQAKNKAGER